MKMMNYTRVHQRTFVFVFVRSFWFNIHLFEVKRKHRRFFSLNEINWTLHFTLIFLWATYGIYWVWWLLSVIIKYASVKLFFEVEFVRHLLHFQWTLNGWFSGLSRPCLFAPKNKNKNKNNGTLKRNINGTDSLFKCYEFKNVENILLCYLAAHCWEDIL